MMMDNTLYRCSYHAALLAILATSTQAFTVDTKGHTIRSMKQLQANNYRMKPLFYRRGDDLNDPFSRTRGNRNENHQNYEQSYNHDTWERYSSDAHTQDQYGNYNPHQDPYVQQPNGYYNQDSRGQNRRQHGYYNQDPRSQGYAQQRYHDSFTQGQGFDYNSDQRHNNHNRYTQEHGQRYNANTHQYSHDPHTQHGNYYNLYDQHHYQYNNGQDPYNQDYNHDPYTQNHYGYENHRPHENFVDPKVRRIENLQAYAFHILEIVEPTDDKKTIKSAYRQMARKKHPDAVLGKDSTEGEKKEASEQFVLVGWAYEMLTKNSEDEWTDPPVEDPNKKTSGKRVDMNPRQSKSYSRTRGGQDDIWTDAGIADEARIAWEKKLHQDFVAWEQKQREIKADWWARTREEFSDAGIWDPNFGCWVS